MAGKGSRPVPSTPNYRSGWERIYCGKKEETPATNYLDDIVSVASCPHGNKLHLHGPTCTEIWEMVDGIPAYRIEVIPNDPEKEEAQEGGTTPTGAEDIASVEKEVVDGDQQDVGRGMEE